MDGRQAGAVLAQGVGVVLAGHADHQADHQGRHQVDQETETNDVGAVGPVGLDKDTVLRVLEPCVAHPVVLDRDPIDRGLGGSPS